MPAHDPATISIAPPEPLPIGFQWEKLSSQALHPWIAAFVGLHAFAIVSGLAAAYYVKVRLDTLSASNSVISRQASEIGGKVGELARAAPPLLARGTRPRGGGGSSSAGQGGFLKISLPKP